MKVYLIAFDSMGVRSIATFIETSEGSFLIDPGASLAPMRYGLPPHEKELTVLGEKLDAIYDFVEKKRLHHHITLP